MKTTQFGYKNSSGGGINVSVDISDSVKKIEKQMKGFEKKVPFVLRAGLNDMAKAIRKAESKAAKKKYEPTNAPLKASLNISQILDFKKATVSNLAAELQTKSPMEDLFKYVVRPRALAYYSSRADQYSGRVLKRSNEVNLYGEDVENVGPNTNQPAQRPHQKAFLVAFQNGKVGLVYRGADKKMKERGWGKTSPINKHNAILYLSRSPGHMSMATSVYGSDTVQDAAEKAFNSVVADKIAYYLNKS